MAAVRKLEYLTPAQYLRDERGRAVRHEYLDGVIRAMAGEKIRHNEICGNLTRATARSSRLRNPCRTVSGNVKVTVPAINRYYYPDFAVSCEPESDEYVIERACFVAEVLSPSTEGIDRFEKRLAYMTLPSLRQYALIDQRCRSVLVYQRDSDGGWIEETLDAGTDVLRIKCLALEVPLDELYAGISLDPA